MVLIYVAYVNVRLSRCQTIELSDYRAVGLAIGSRVKDNNPLGTSKTVSLDFDKE